MYSENWGGVPATPIPGFFTRLHRRVRSRNCNWDRPGNGPFYANHTEQTESNPEMETQAAVPKNLHLQRHLYSGGAHAHGDSYRNVQLALVCLPLDSCRRPCTSRPTWFS